MSDIIVAYFSHSGMNYFGGSIVDLDVGNTQTAAEKVAAMTGGDLFEIEATKPYPRDYGQCTDIAKRELDENARPVLLRTADVSPYDTVILCYPNWWGTMPMAVWTFLESADLRGKTVMPLCTHEGSAMGVSERDLKKLCPDAILKKGLAVYGSGVNNSDADIQKWLDASGIEQIKIRRRDE